MKKILTAITILLVVPLFAAAPVKKQASRQLKTEAQRLGYAIGQSVGAHIKNLKEKVDIHFFELGVTDAVNGKKPLMSPKEVGRTMRALNTRLRAKNMAAMKKLAAKDTLAGKAFLAANKTKKGVITLPDGLQYQIIKKGSGAVPTLNDRVTVNYRGSLIDGRVFDSSYKRGKPATFRLRGVIKGWSEALQHMRVGGKYKVFIPSELAYGPRGRGRVIPPNSTLIFDIDLLDIQANAPKTPAAAPKKAPIQKKK